MLLGGLATFAGARSASPGVAPRTPRGGSGGDSPGGDPQGPRGGFAAGKLPPN